MEDTVPDHHHQEEEEKVEEYVLKGSTKRSYYGCTFCKQGFTNAQALGGHMNIHRKHRVVANKKAKQEEETISRSSINKDQSHGREFLRYYSSIFEAPKNLHIMNPRNPSSSCCSEYEFLNPRWYSQSLNVKNQDEFLVSADLTLQIGPTHVDVNGDRSSETEEDGEVDLELRLGHHPS